jgi:hypothetical protein
MRVYLLGAASLLAGLKLTKLLTGPTLGNIHHLGSLAYTILKLPYNFCDSFLGIRLWTNTLAGCPPTWSMNIPMLGNISQVGICGYVPKMQLILVSAWICEFGLLGILAAFLVPRWKKVLQQALYMRFCVIYGVACFLLVPLIGSATDRLASYSWPMFLVAVPILYGDVIQLRGNLALPIVLASCSSWLFFFGCIHYSSPLLIVAITLSIFALLFIRGRIIAENPSMNSQQTDSL